MTKDQKQKIRRNSWSQIVTFHQIFHILACYGILRLVTNCYIPSKTIVTSFGVTIFYFQIFTDRHFASQFVTASYYVTFRHKSSCDGKITNVVLQVSCIFIKYT